MLVGDERAGSDLEVPQSAVVQELVQQGHADTQLRRCVADRVDRPFGVAELEPLTASANAIASWVRSCWSCSSSASYCSEWLSNRLRSCRAVVPTTISVSVPMLCTSTVSGGLRRAMRGGLVPPPGPVNRALEDAQGRATTCGTVVHGLARLCDDTGGDVWEFAGERRVTAARRVRRTPFWRLGRPRRTPRAGWRGRAGAWRRAGRVG